MFDLILVEDSEDLPLLLLWFGHTLFYIRDLADDVCSFGILKSQLGMSLIMLCRSYQVQGQGPGFTHNNFLNFAGRRPMKSRPCAVCDSIE